jgi:hypothetical protein
MGFLTPQGEATIIVRRSRDATRIAEHRNAVKSYVHTGDISALAKFKGKSIRAGGVTYTFVTDPKILDRLARADLLAIDSLYKAIQ